MDKKKEILDIASSVFENAADNIINSKNKLSEKFFDAVELICKSNKIIISGVGKSGLIARKIAATFTSYGFVSMFLHPVEALHGDIGNVKKHDVAVLLSKSGTSDDIIRIVPFLKSRAVKIIALTGNQNSFLANNSDIVLDGSIDREACLFNIAPTTSTTLALVIGDALAVCASKYNELDIEHFSKNHPLGQIGKNLTLRVKDIMHKDNELPLVLSGASFKDAIIEITNKKLGCVCIVDEKKYLLGIITDGDVRRTLQKHDDISNLKVEDIMTSKPVTINQKTMLGDALSIMESRESQINILPVVSDAHECIGVIRIHDILRSGI